MSKQEFKEVLEALRRLVIACTPTGIPSDSGRNFGTRMPKKEEVERARRLVEKHTIDCQCNKCQIFTSSVR